MYRPIALSLSPNTQKEDVFLALRLFFTPWRYKNGGAVKQVEQWFRNYFDSSYAVSFASGRASLIVILRALEVGEGDEVILQAFTCVAVPNAIISTNAMPIYADITDALTMDPLLLEKKISKKTKAIIVQHTFGIPSNMDTILSLAKKHNIPVIEDVAHSIGGTYHGKKLGTFGIASFFSFGRDKAFSSVFGGIAMTDDEELGKKIRAFQKNLKDPSFFWVAQQLLHPILFSFILPLYDFFSIGKVFLVIFQKLQLLSFPVTRIEKGGVTDPQFVKKFPNALATLLLFQLKRLQAYNDRRTAIVKQYIDIFQNKKEKMPCHEPTPLLRFPLAVDDPTALKLLLRRYTIYSGNWYASVVDPKTTAYEAIHYTFGMCPNAEKIAAHIINLPTYPIMTENDVKKVVTVLKNYVAK